MNRPRQVEGLRVALIGAGYVGLVTGACLASAGHHVTLVEKDRRKIRLIRKGTMPFFEPGLDSLVSDGIEADRLSVTDAMAAAVGDADVVMIAVGTPVDAQGRYDLGALMGVAGDLRQCLSGETVVLVRSTVPCGTAQRVSLLLNEGRSVKVSVACNPEFLREGSALDDFLNADRIVAGLDPEGDPVAERTIHALYDPFQRPILISDWNSAEMVKTASNAYLATRVSFINLIASLCERAGADIDFVRRGMGCDPRIGFSYLQAGVGYGGSCLPKDCRALIAFAESLEVHAGLLREVEAVNRQRAMAVGAKLAAHLKPSLAGKRVAVWGLAFKPNTDDTRDSQTWPVVSDLVARGTEVRLSDPKATLSEPLTGVTWCDDPLEACRGADALVLMTEWPEYVKVDFRSIRKVLHSPVIVDARNALDRSALEGLGFTYMGMGRPDSRSARSREVAVAPWPS